MEIITEAASSMAKIFMRLRKHGKMTVVEGAPLDSPQALIVAWLNERYGDFVKNLMSLLRSEKGNFQVRFRLEEKC